MSVAKTRKAGSVKGRNPARTKRRIAPTAIRLKRAAITGFGKELKEAREQQAATAKILKVIASSPGDVQPVLEAVAEQANRLVGGVTTVVWRILDDVAHLAAFTRADPAADAALKAAAFRIPLSSWQVGETIRKGKVFSVADTERDVRSLRDLARLRGFRSVLYVPMLRNHEPIGIIGVTRAKPGRFAGHHVQLLQTFADQAVIAIGNARLFDEVQAKTRDLEEALVYQTGSSNILKVIASSPTDVGPALKAIVESACEICGAYDAVVFLKDGGDLVFSAHHGPIPLRMDRWPISRKWITGRALADKAPQHIHDLYGPEGDDFPEGRELSRHQGTRTALSVPLLREGEAIGVISLRRIEVQPFNDKQVALLESFADQAVIAIENVRLFDELQAKTRDLEESLQQQTATSEVLQVISSSPGDLAPVFDKMLESATRVCGAEFGSMYLVEDDSLRQAALYNVPVALAAARTNKIFRPSPQSAITTAIRTKHAAQVADVRTTAAYLERAPHAVELVELGGARTAVTVPMLREDEVIGAITIYRQEVRPFADKQIELLSNFAKQAVIAIENARLLKELRQSLQQQTATADVLKIISRSSVDLETVLDTLVETAARLCRADQANMFRHRDDRYHLVAWHGLSDEAKEFLLTHPLSADRGTLSGRVQLERRTVHIPDVLTDPEYTYREGQKIQGHRTMLGIPLLRQDSLVGIFSINRTRVDPFTDKEIELATSFADQAVIAIENARLFEELRDRQAELRVTFDNMGDGVVMFDAAGRLAAWNRNFQEMLEFPDAFLAGRPSYAEYFRYLADRGEYSTDLEAQLSRTIEDTSREMRFERTRPDGRVIEVRRNPVPGGGFVLIYSDITERKRAEEAIRLARDAAEKALRDLQTAQDRLVQTEKLASLGQLTAGIAHEIKNPLNFVNNFSALSVELTDELNDVLKQAEVAEKIQKEVSELTQMLKSNLEKVVQHGKRADSIVKNMLLHARSGSGEHRPVEINGIVEESLNLAYHGARAEGRDFNITLERDFDQAGVADIYPQEITRALLNLISNGFYAATQRAMATGDGFEPKLKAVTRNLGDRVEVRIRDNGTGIPPEIQEKIFNPFFTTKPAGEGTGLGLSMSHDIVVKQHGGTIEVVTEPGSFTEFIITLPRIMPA